MAYPFNYPPAGDSDVWPLARSLSRVESWQQWPGIDKYMRDIEGNPTLEEMQNPVQFINDVREVYWKNIAPRVLKLWGEGDDEYLNLTEVIHNAIDALSKPGRFSIYQRWAGLYKTFALARFLTDEAANTSNYGRGVLLYNEPAIFSDLVMGKYIEALLALPDPERLLKFEVSAHHNDVVWSDEIMVLTEDEAWDLARDDIRDSISIFSVNWLSQMTGYPQVIFSAIQNDDMAEPLRQSAMMALIEGSCGWDEFVDASIAQDGIGHFVGSYDGEASEYNIFGKDYIVFRTG